MCAFALLHVFSFHACVTLIAFEVLMRVYASAPQAAIRKELNEFKSREMEVHEESKHFTRWVASSTPPIGSLAGCWSPTERQTDLEFSPTKRLLCYRSSLKQSPAVSTNPGLNVTALIK